MGLMEDMAARLTEAAGQKIIESRAQAKTRVRGEARNAQASVLEANQKLINWGLISSNGFEYGVEGVGLIRDEFGVEYYSELKQGVKVGYPVYYNNALGMIAHYLEKSIKDAGQEGQVQVIFDPNYEDDFFAGLVFIEAIVIEPEIAEGNRLVRDAGIYRAEDKAHYNIEAVNNGRNTIITFHDPVISHTVESIVNSFSKLKDHENFSYIDHSVRNPDGSWLKVSLLRQVDPKLATGNSLLREADIIKKDDLTLYKVKGVIESDYVAVQINDPMFSHSIESILTSLGKLKDVYHFKYVNSTKDLPGIWLQAKLIKRADSAVIEANELLREVGVISDNDLKLYNVKLDKSNDDEYVLEINEIIRGVTSKDIVTRSESMKGRFDARIVRPFYLAGDLLRLFFVRKDFLDSARLSKVLPDFDPQKMAVTCATDAFGEDVEIVFESVPGWMVSGVPGSGKTAGVTSFLTPLALSDLVKLSIIDCKGGDDWETYKDVAHAYTSGVHNEELLAKAHDIIMSAEARLNERVAKMKSLTGKTNFWNLTVEQRRAAGLEFDLLVIDECQNLFPNKIPRNKMGDYFNEIEPALENLVRKGRSGGVAVLFITQKFTMADLPTGIRDNCSGRMSFKLSNHNACAMTFPNLDFVAGVPDPCKIPLSRKGGAIFLDANENPVEVRFYYTPEEDIEKLLKTLSPEKKAKLMDKILKLHALYDNSSFEGEKENALTAIKRIKGKYEISDAQVSNYKKTGKVA